MPASDSARTIDLLQIFFGWPRPLFPCGFHSRAILVMLTGGFLSVRPIYRHLMRFICHRMSSSFVNHNIGLLMLVCGQNILQIIRRHLLTKNCSLYVRVLETRIACNAHTFNNNKNIKIYNKKKSKSIENKQSKYR